MLVKSISAGHPRPASYLVKTTGPYGLRRIEDISFGKTLGDPIARFLAKHLTSACGDPNDNRVVIEYDCSEADAWRAVARNRINRNPPLWTLKRTELIIRMHDAKNSPATVDWDFAPIRAGQTPEQWLALEVQAMREWPKTQAGMSDVGIASVNWIERPINGREKKYQEEW